MPTAWPAGIQGSGSGLAPPFMSRCDRSFPNLVTSKVDYDRRVRAIQDLGRASVITLAVIVASVALTAHASAATPACGNLFPSEPVQFYSPSPLQLKVFVGGCFWDEAERGASAIVTLTVTGPNYASQLLMTTYGLVPGGPLGSPWLYSVPGLTTVPSAGTYTLTVDEQYPYAAVPLSASSSYTTAVAGATPTPTIAPTAAPTPRATTPGPTTQPAQTSTPQPAQTPTPRPSATTDPATTVAATPGSTTGGASSSASASSTGTRQPSAIGRSPSSSAEPSDSETIPPDFPLAPVAIAVGVGGLVSGLPSGAFEGAVPQTGSAAESSAAVVNLGAWLIGCRDCLALSPGPAHATSASTPPGSAMSRPPGQRWSEALTSP